MLLSRETLITALEHYRNIAITECETIDNIIQFVRNHNDCFARENIVGHITGSAWLLNQTEDKVLLTHHKKLGKWLQLGGHADGCGDILTVAQTEAREESGIDAIVPLQNTIFSVDIHLIPEYRRQNLLEPQHYHYDITYLFKVADNSAYCVSDESHALAWFTIPELMQKPLDDNVLRMAKKWQQRLPLVNQH